MLHTLADVSAFKRKTMTEKERARLCIRATKYDIKGVRAERHSECVRPRARTFAPGVSFAQSLK